MKGQFPTSSGRASRSPADNCTRQGPDHEASAAPDLRKRTRTKRITDLIPAARRELAQRVNDGLEITLYWNEHDNSTSIEVHHSTTGQTIGFLVPRDRALDAFHHPFAHLANKVPSPEIPAASPATES